MRAFLVVIFQILCCSTAYSQMQLTGAGMCEAHHYNIYSGPYTESLYCRGLGGTADPWRTVDLLPGDYFDLGSANGPSQLGSSSAAFHVRADFGDIGVLADAKVNTGYVRLDLNRQMIGEGRAHANAQVSFTDRITVQSDSLAVGTPVSLVFSGGLDATMVSYSTDERLAIARGQLEAAATIHGGGASGNVFHSVSYCLNVASTSCTRTSDGSFEIAFTGFVGDVYWINGMMNATAVAGAGANETFGGATAWGRASSLTSLNTFLTPQTSHVELRSASGHDYAVAVPEPSTWALFVAGLMALVAYRQRRGAPLESTSINLKKTRRGLERRQGGVPQPATQPARGFLRRSMQE